MAKFDKFGNEQDWIEYVQEFLTLQTNLFGVWLYEAQWTYYGNVEDGRPHGHGRVVYRNGDCYEGKWKNGFMEKGQYVKYRNPGTSMDRNWFFSGTFTTEGDCPVEGKFNDGDKELHVTCTEMKDIHKLECWQMLKGLRDKKVAEKEAEVNSWILTKRWEDAQPMIDKFKKIWISGNYQECSTTITLSPVVLFLCSGNDIIECNYSDVEKGPMTGREGITKESRIVATIPRVPTKIQVWLWCQEHLEARMDEDIKKDVFHNPQRKIAELDFSSAQFEYGAVVRHTLKLNKARNPFSMLIHLEFRLQNTGGVSTDLGSLLATLRTYV